MTIVRGQFTAVWGFIQNKEDNQTLMVLDITMNNEGILNEQQNTNLTLRYLQRIGNIENYIIQKTIKGEDMSVQLFDLDWVSEPNKPKNFVKKIASFNQNKVESDNFKSIISPGETDVIRVE